MQISILSKSPLGRWSVGLAVAFVLFFALFQVLVASGLRGPIMFSGRPVPFINWSLPLYAAGISGIAALVTGLISIIKSKERSILTFLATLIGLLVPLFLLGEFLIPH
jgi:hypothetical protein